MKTIVIGAGAAGLTAAIFAAKSGASVTVIEHEDKPAKKLLVTGNGKCNITNTDMSADKFYGDRNFIKNILNEFGVGETFDYFNEMGVLLKDKNGYIYPASGQAASVAGTLCSYAGKLGVKIKTNNNIKNIKFLNPGFEIDVGIKITCDKLIIAAGGMTFPSTGSDGSGYGLAKMLGHGVICPEPALTALVCEPDRLNKASGVRITAGVSVSSAHQVGELQITGYGISGIPVFNISRLADIGSRVLIDFAPDSSPEELTANLNSIFESRKYMSAVNALNGMLHKKISEVMCEKIGFGKNSKAGDVSKSDIQNIARLLKAYPLTVKSKRGCNFAQVTRGGVPLSEVDCATMQSNIVDGLYFAGEILDADGVCGGYNLQFAWATGAIAGRNCGK